MLASGNHEGRRFRRTRRMGKLIMVRHGESEGNRDRRFNVTPDIPITELGRKQAQEAAERIARMFRPEAIIASPYLRARQTAEIIAEPLGLPVEVVDDRQALASLRAQNRPVFWATDGSILEARAAFYCPDRMRRRRGR